MNKFLDEKVKILIVDDVELSTRTLKHLLENILTGEYEIDILHHGDVVVDVIERNGYNLVFLDNRLPGKDGLSILKEIRQKDIDTNVIFLTGYSDEETAVKAMKLGAKDYIPKGNLDVQRLLEAINEVVLESCFILDIPPKIRSILKDHFTETNVLAPRQSLKHVFGEGQVLEKELVEALDLISEKKGMKRKWEYSALVCPECRSPADEIKLTCPVCSSQKLVKGEVIEHHKCGHVDFGTNFLDADGKFVCPKCGEKLEQIGVDYAKIGTSYMCDDNHIMSSPEHSYVCRECEEEFTEDRGEMIRVYRYEITEKGALSMDICRVVREQQDLDNSTVQLPVLSE